MKKIITDTIITDYDGNPMVEQIDPKSKAAPITVRHILRMYAGSFVPQQNDPKAVEESVIANAVALKIHAANGAIELTDEEYDVLKKTMAIPRHAAMIYAQVHGVVMNAEEN
jgi:hypothetical protein